MAGRFFNDESIEKGLGLHRLDEAPFGEPDQEWFSICSAHFYFDPECHICQVGSWLTPDEKGRKFRDEHPDPNRPKPAV